VTPRLYKTVLVLAAALLLAAGGQLQNSLDRERVRLGLTPLPNDPAMPPLLALTTQALGGFRGLIANALWIRGNDLQLEGKYFEMVQLAHWISLLQPHFVQVWIVQAWNMGYNISVAFSDYGDRWRWVRHAIELLRDEALRYNPDEALIYRELAWHFQHKMGMNLDDAHFYYKRAWAAEMTRLFTTNAPFKFDGHPNFEELINPQTDEARARAAKLRDEYKMDARKMKEVDDHYGPLDWRLPEAHAIYWAWLGLAKSKPADLITLRRVIYQSMKYSVDRGRLTVAANGQIYLGPNLDNLTNANAAYEEMFGLEEVPPQRDGIKTAHRNFLKEVPYQLYINNRIADAQDWLKTLRTKYPDAIPADLSLTDYALRRAMEKMGDGTQVQVAAFIEALVLQSYRCLVEDDDDQAAQYMQRAQEMHLAYDRKPKGAERLRITPLDEMKKEVLYQLLEPKSGLAPEVRDHLRKRLGLPAEATPAPPNAKN